MERKRIEKFGGTLAKKAGVQRVVWSRPKLKNPRQDLVEGDTMEYEHVPFLAVTRSLGDLWSYDAHQDVYHISPEPDVQCISLNTLEHRCVIIGSDGLWNVVSIKAAIELIRICERETERRVFLDPNINSNFFYNPAASLVKYAMSQWKRLNMRADNVSALVIMIDPPGPSMTKRREDRRKSNFSSLDMLSSLICDSPSNESFSKQLTNEFLVECSRWRSANELKIDQDIGTSIDTKSKISQEPECELNYSSCLTTSSNKHGPSDENSSKSSESETLVNLPNAKIPYSISQNSIISNSFYFKYCVSWINNFKVWTFVSVYFQSQGLNNEADIIQFLNSMDPNLAGEILRLMPWIFVAKNTFKCNTPIQIALNRISLFSEFWIDLYTKHIKSLEKTCLAIEFTNMHAIINIIKPNILSLLENYNYIGSPFNVEKVPIQCGNGGNNKNNETLERYVRNKYTLSDSVRKTRKHFNLFKVPDNARLKVFLNSRSKNHFTKLARFIQSDKKNLQTKESFLSRRSMSDKQISNTPWLLKSPSSQLENLQKLPSLHLLPERSSDSHQRRRHSTTNAQNTKHKVLSQNISNCSGIYYQEYIKNIFPKVINQENQSNLFNDFFPSVTSSSDIKGYCGLNQNPGQECSNLLSMNLHL